MPKLGEPMPDFSFGNKFKNSTGMHYLGMLFYEEVNSDKSTVLYTLKDHDHQGFPSLYRLYMEMADPLEYIFANKYLDGYDHWDKLCACTWFRDYVSRWRHELELKLRSEALVRILADAKTNSRSSAASNRILLDGAWDLSRKNQKGRPSKADIRDEAKRMALQKFEEAADLARMEIPQ